MKLHDGPVIEVCNRAATNHFTKSLSENSNVGTDNVVTSVGTPVHIYRTVCLLGNLETWLVLSEIIRSITCIHEQLYLQ